MFLDILTQLLKKKHRAYYLKYISLIYQIKVETIVEIGVFKGKNAQALHRLFPSAHLYLVDPWMPTEEYLASGSAVAFDPEIYRQALKRVETLFKDNPQVTLIQQEGSVAAPLLPDNLDLVFIDANHTFEAVRTDALTYLPKIRPGGILAGHNFGRRRMPDVRQAVESLFREDYLLGQDEVWLHFR